MSLDVIVPLTEIMSGDLLEDLMSSEGMFAHRRAGIFVFFRCSQKDSKVERLCRKIVARTCWSSFGWKHRLSLDCWHDSTNIWVLFGIKWRRKSHHAVRCLILVLYNRSHVFLFHPQCSLLSSACRLHPVTTTTYTTWTRQKVCVTCLTSPFSTSDLRDCRQSRKQLAQI